MAERRSSRRRVFLEDARRNGLYLRATWHAEAGQFVVSTWRDEVCTGAVRLRADEAAELIGLLADGLADGATAQPVPAPPEATHRFDRLRSWLRRSA